MTRIEQIKLVQDMSGLSLYMSRQIVDALIPQTFTAVDARETVGMLARLMQSSYVSGHDHLETCVRDVCTIAKVAGGIDD